MHLRPIRDFAIEGHRRDALAESLVIPEDARVLAVIARPLVLEVTSRGVALWPVKDRANRTSPPIMNSASKRSDSGVERGNE